MGGKSSRDKGKRSEYLVRDYMRSLGLKADRVPSSGAAQGFKGDVKIEAPDGRIALVEVKSRQNEFKSIYAWYQNTQHDKEWKRIPYLRLIDNSTLIISEWFTDLDMLLPPTEGRRACFHEAPNNVVKKLTTMRKLLNTSRPDKSCDFLAIKINHKPFLYLRYLGGLSANNNLKG